MTHGTRHAYQRGCTCLPCRRANSAYSAQLRRQLRRGPLPLGCRVDARGTWRLIGKLLKEGFTKGEIARRLGLQSPELQFDTVKVRVKTERRMQAFYDAIMAEGPELTV